MSSAIGSATKTPYTPPTAAPVQQSQPAVRDSDGDNDGSKAGAVEPAKATSGPVGTIINTTA
jgi:hypothetical protein